MMRISFPSVALALLTGAAAICQNGVVAAETSQNTRRNSDLTSISASGTASRISKLIEIKEETESSRINNKNEQQLGISHNQVERELGKIFSEAVDHWDRMLEAASSFVPTKEPTKKPTTKSPVVAPTISAEPTTEYVPTYVPSDVGTDYETDEPTYFPTDYATSGNVTYSPTTTTTAVPSATNPTAPNPILPETTWDILLSRPEEFSILIAASEAVGFDEVLQNSEDRTIFAPNDVAFKNLMPADLLDKYFNFEAWTNEYISRLLFCHDVAGSIIFSFQFQNDTKLLPCLDFVDPAFLITTPPLQISKSTMPEPANVVEGDLLALNGVIHVIDQVMTNSFLRLDLPSAAAAWGGFDILLDLVTVAGLVDALSGPGPFTLFAPPDEVFLRYGEEFIENLKGDPDALGAILLNHVVTDLIIPCCLLDGAEYESAAGFPVVIANTDPAEPRSFTVNGVETIPALTGLLASNGKVNAINDILFLPDTPIPAPTNAPDVPPSTEPGVVTGTTWDIIKSRPEEFATFIVASEAVGFDTILQQPVNRTIFVPNEAGFASVMPPDLLAKYLDFDTWTKEYVEVLLFCHELTDVVILSSDLANGTEITPCIDLIDPVVVITLPPPMLSKQTMPVPASIVEVDLVTDNGVIHVIDQVITNSFLRYNVVEAAGFAGGYSVLLELLELTGLLETATGPGPITIFAPSDEVFESKGLEFLDGLKADINGTKTILLNHIVSGVIIPCCLGESTTYINAAGESLTLDNYNPNNPSDFTVNGIPTIPGGTDLLTKNAKVNTISDILVLPQPTESPMDAPSASLSPSSFVPSLGDTSMSPGSFIPSLGDTSMSPGSFIPSLGDTSMSPGSFIPSLGDTSMSPLPPDSVWDLLTESSEEFATFISAAEAVGYDDILRNSPSITVFAPNELAFSNLLPPDLLVKYFQTDAWTTEYIMQLLSCHDIDGAAIVSSDLFSGAEFATCMDLLDPEFTFTSPPPQIAKETMPVPATVVGPDQESLNGVVHVVDQVFTTSFLRFNMPEAAEALGTFNILLELVVLTDLLEFVEGDGPFTIYAPFDAVFESYGAEFIEELKVDVGGTRELLLNHVVPDEIVACCLDVTTEFTSAAGFPLVLDNFSSDDPNIFTVNDVAIVPEFANFLTSNAKISVISDFLLPPNLS